MSDQREDATRILMRISEGTESPAALMPIVYQELRSIAGDLMRRERGDHTLQPTALVHEVFVRLIEQQGSLGAHRRDFLALSAQAMRNYLVDHARKHNAEKRGGSRDRMTLGEASDQPQEEVDILDLHVALEELARLDERQARIIEMVFFAGMTGQEIADHLGVHRNTVLRDLRMARAWLRRAMGPAPSSPDES